MQLAPQFLVGDPRHPLDVGRPVGEQRLELAAPDDPERDLGREPRGGEDRLHAVERDELADEEAGPGLGRAPSPPEEPVLGAGQPDPSHGSRARRPAPPPLPHRYVPLDDLDSRTPERRDDLRVARIVPLVRAEMQAPQDRISSTSRSARSRSGARSSWWLVIISLIRPSEKNWRPTTTRSTPSVSSGRPPIAWPPSLRIVR